MTPFQSMENAPDDEGYCGDGIVQIASGEECDDRNRVVTDTCVSKSSGHVKLSAVAPKLYFALHIIFPFPFPIHRV